MKPCDEIRKQKQGMPAEGSVNQIYTSTNGRQECKLPEAIGMNVKLTELIATVWKTFVS